MSYADYVARLTARPKLSVRYQCNEQCGRQHVVEELYFCSTCKRLVCDDCSGVQIDAYYCPHCLSSVLSYDAFQDENRCERTVC